MSVGKLIKKKRLYLELTRKELAELTGMSKEHIYKLERDLYPNGISLEGAMALSRELDIPLDNIMLASLEKRMERR